MRVVGYLRCSTAEQRESGLGVQAQATAIEAEAARRGWEIVAVLSDEGASGKSLSGRPGLGEALALVESGAADVICVSKLDRLSRSVVDFAGLVARAHASGWSLRALDVDLDMTTPVGGLIANILASVAEWERKVIAARTKAALQAAAARGQKLGRPRRMSAEAIARIGELHLAGHRPLEIARRLNEERIPTPTGSGVWHSHGVERGLRWARSTPAE